MRGFFLAGVIAGAATNVREYRFEVSYFKVNPDRTGAAWVQGINGMLPGPEVRVRQHERLRVTVVNLLQTEEVSIHWHGFEMRQDAKAYDGAMGITQCGIKPGETFVYDFVVDEHPGTYQYHEHAKLEHVAARGLFGALIVEPPEGAPEPWGYDREETLLLFDWWPRAPHMEELMKWSGLTRQGTPSKAFNGVGLLPFHNLLINGKGAFAVFAEPEAPLAPSYVSGETRVADLAHVAPSRGETWRLRVENAGALFAMRFRIDGHRLRVVQADGADVEPYDCDAISMSSGERFDVLVTFDQDAGSYWMRAETLEHHYGWHHGQLGVVRYQGAPAGLLPDRGFPLRHSYYDAPHLKTLNCVDEGPISGTCRPITDLRRRARQGYVGHAVDVGTGTGATHDFEVNFRAYAQPDDAHFTRVIDLSGGGNPFENQFDGEYVQLKPPAVPFSHVNGTEDAMHQNTVHMRVGLNETVRVFFQLQDRVAHPWHLHGHKFAVLATGFPDYERDCDVLFCRSGRDSRIRWVSKDGPPEPLLDPAEAPLKDTVHVPAGGWVVIQFKADNPGWWFFHCHMLIHVHDGMGLVLIEAPEHVERHLVDPAWYDSRGFPSCAKELEAFEERGAGHGCRCWEDPERYLDNNLRSTYLCAYGYLCGDRHLSRLEPASSTSPGARNRASGRAWRFAMMAAEWLLVLLFFVAKWVSKARDAVFAARLVDKLVCEEAEEDEFDFDDGLDIHVTAALPKDIECAAQLAPDEFTRLTMPKGSVVNLLGPVRFTEPWLAFLAGRRRPGVPVVVGELRFEQIRQEDIAASDLRALRSYVYDVVPLMPHVTLVKMLEHHLRLTTAPRLYTGGTLHAYIIRFLGMFGLTRFAATPVGQLGQSELRKAVIAQEMLLPRALLVLKEPLAGLQPREYTDLVAQFSRVARRMHATVVFSSTSMVAGAAEHVNQTVLLGRENPLAVGDEDQLRAFCTEMSEPPPRGSHTVEWCSDLLSHGRFEARAPADRPTSFFDYARHSTRSSVAAARRSAGASRLSAGGPSSRLSGLSARSPRVSIGSSSTTSSWLKERIKRRSSWAKKRISTTGRRPKSCAVQLWVLFKYQFVSDLHEYITVYKLMESFFVGLFAGFVWFQKGALETQTGLGESVGLFFFTTALWTVPPVFQALAASRQIYARCIVHCLAGVHAVHAAIIATAISSYIVGAVWTSAWQVTAYAFADLGKDVPTILQMHLVLSLNVFTMRTIGLFLGLVIPNNMLNTVIANLVAQLFMLTNGFYTKLPDWFNWVTYFSIPRRTFVALLKLEYSWRDTFAVNPMLGRAGAGFPSRWIPAETTGFFALMRDRGLGVMQSPHDASILSELVQLVCTSAFFLLLFYATVRWKLHQLEKLDHVRRYMISKIDQERCDTSPECLSI